MRFFLSFIKSNQIYTFALRNVSVVISPVTFYVHEMSANLVLAVMVAVVFLVMLAPLYSKTVTLTLFDQLTCNHGQLNRNA